MKLGVIYQLVYKLSKNTILIISHEVVSLGTSAPPVSDDTVGNTLLNFHLNLPYLQLPTANADYCNATEHLPVRVNWAKPRHSMILGFLFI